MNRNFKCMECGGINSSKLWNEATVEVFGHPLHPIEEYVMKTDWDGAFVCPTCYGNLEKSENKIIEVL